MANVQKENGYTAIANELLEALIQYRFPVKSSLPLKLCLFVIRKTYGYHKKMDIISLSQFQKATNEKNRTNLVYWVRYLVQAKILVRIKKSDTQIEYGFNKDYEEWLTPVQTTLLVQTRSYTSANNSTRGSANNATESSANNATHKRKKESIKENTKETGVSVVLGEFKNVKLTEEEIIHLEEKIGRERVIELIEELSTYMASKKTSYKSHYATIVSWYRRKNSDIKSNSKKLYVG